MRLRARATVLAGLTGLIVVVPVATAQAHPLGNFTVNHYNGLVLHADGLDLHAVVDSAEIPTQQELPSIDTDGDGATSAAELATHADSQCADLAGAVRLGVDGTAVPWSVQESTLETRPGAAGLPTLRLTCALVAAADLSNASTVSFVDEYRSDRVGWHEITAQGQGVRLVDPPVPAISISDELRTYPEDLLSSPLADTSVTLQIEPGDGASGQGAGTTGASQDPFTRLIGAGDNRLQDIVEGELTPTLGVLSVLLAVLLGAGHAMLPGHGKSVMAAYLAGRRGSRRDAMTVGAMVTVTHTASVLVLGLLISVSAAIVGEQALRYLGVVSGLLIALVGGLLLREALRSRRRREQLPTPVAALAIAGAQVRTAAEVQHGQDHASGSAGSHQHSHGDGYTHDGHTHGAGATGAHAHGDEGNQGHSHGNGQPRDHTHGGGPPDHSHDHAHDDEGAHGHSHGAGVSGWLSHSHSHVEGSEHGHSHEPRPQGDEPSAEPRASRGGLIGMGIAGGLVPSPSALVVLLGSAALGRTVFGVLLVLFYGLGMAATLTAVGLLLVRVRRRLDRFDTAGRLSVGASRVVAALPVITATLVLVVGVGLAVRGLITPV